VHMGYTGAGDVDDMVDRAQAEVYEVTERRTSEDYLPLKDIMGDALNEIEAISNRGGEMIGVPTGFADLDSLTNGLHAGQLIILAARPAIGKSTFGLDICRAASIKHGLTSVIFSLEMSRNEIVMRLLSAEAQVPLHHMRAGTMSDSDWGKMATKMGTVSDAPLFIDDSPNMTLMEIRAKCRRLKQRHGLRLVVVDYLQLMTSGKRVESRQQEVSEFSRSLKLLAKELEVPVIAISQLNRGPEQRTVVVDYLQLMTSGKRVESRQQEVSEFSRSLKLLAKELEVPVIAISQLNRGPEQRTDKKPMLADLRESGSLEQDADMVILLSREDAYERESPRAGEADFIVAKHRNGPTATVTVAFQGHYSRFVDMAQT